MKQPHMQSTLYHSFLRIGVVVFAFALLFDSGMLFPVTQQLSQGTQQYVANMVSVSVGVAPTELNTLTAELTEQKLALEAREQALVEREINVTTNESRGTQTDISTYILSVLLFILLALIVLNYGLDYVRMKRLSELSHA